MKKDKDGKNYKEKNEIFEFLVSTIIKYLYLIKIGSIRNNEL